MISRTPSPNDIRALQITPNDDGTTTISIRNYDDEVLKQRTVTSASLNWVIRDMGIEAIKTAQRYGVKYNEVNRLYASGSWKRKRD